MQYSLRHRFLPSSTALPTLSLLGLSLIACNNSGVLGNTDGDVASGEDTAAPGGDTGDTTPDSDTQIWEGATLAVLSPRSGDFLPLGEDTSFEAVVYSADGEPMDFEDIAWESDVDASWGPTGALFEDRSLGVGTHAITASALLPNGDRLVYTMGGILVQHEDAGTYVGDVRVDVTLSWNGKDYTVGCTGATTMIVDVYGETATGDSTCVLALLGYDLETTYLFDLAADAGALAGLAQIDLTLFSYDIDMTGTVGDGELTGTWTSADFVATAGELNTSRVTRDVGDGQ